MKKKALILGIAVIISSILFVGTVDPKTGFPEPIPVNGETIEFTWTDDNSGEDLIIYTDKATYSNGLSHATVYVAVENRSGVDQEVELMGLFRDSKQKISNISVLHEVTQEVPTYETKQECVATTTKKVATTTCSEIQVQTGTSTETYKAWQPLAQKTRTATEKTEEQSKLADVTRKSVEDFTAETKSVAYSVPSGGVVYYKVGVEFPPNSDDNFYFEAIGSQGGYGHLDPWFSASWTYRVKIEVNPSKVGTTTAITSIPVFVDLANLPAGFHTNVKADGCDIRVVESDNTTETAFELVSYASTTDNGELHFMADTLATSTASSTFYIYYGNSGASCYAVTDTYGRNAVWGGYASVYHWEHTSGNATDSTGNSLTLTNNGTTGYTTNQIYNGPDYGTSNSTKSHSRTSSGFAGGSFTFTSWAKIRTEPTSGQAHQILVPRKGSPQAIDAILGYRNDAGTAKVFFDRGKSGVGSFEVTENVTLGTSNWHHLHMTYDGTTLRGYRNGTSVGTPLATSGNGSGGGDALVVAGYSGSRVSAYLDEVRISNTAYSASWILTEYNNQSAPTTFYWVGPQETDTPAGSSQVDEYWDDV